MMAWVDLESLDETLATGRVCYWSRSRGKLWRKGESSSRVQQLKEMPLDCDGDTLLLVDQTGPACHAGRGNCFYNAVRGDRFEFIAEPLIDPDELYRLLPCGLSAEPSRSQVDCLIAELPGPRCEALSRATLTSKPCVAQLRARIMEAALPRAGREAGPLRTGIP